MKEDRPVAFFSIPVDSLPKEQLYFSLRERMRQHQQSSIATVNPEILLQAKKNAKFTETLKKCSYRLVDGFGISFVSFFKYRVTLSRCVGRDALDVCCNLAREFRLTVGIVGGSVGISREAAKKLALAYPDVRFVDLSNNQDIVVNNSGDIEKGSEHIHHSLSQHKIGMVIAGFGVQKQESWILRFLQENQSCLCGIGVGGILDVLAGKIRKAPYIFSVLGLEWFWRLCMQPSRFTRIINAVIVFPFKALVYG